MRADSEEAIQYSRLQETIASASLLAWCEQAMTPIPCPPSHPESGPHSAPSLRHCLIHCMSAVENSLNDISRQGCGPDTVEDTKPNRRRGDSNGGGRTRLRPGERCNASQRSSTRIRIF